GAGRWCAPGDRPGRAQLHVSSHFLSAFEVLKQSFDDRRGGLTQLRPLDATVGFEPFQGFGERGEAVLSFIERMIPLGRVVMLHVNARRAVGRAANVYGLTDSWPVRRLSGRSHPETPLEEFLELSTRLAPPLQGSALTSCGHRSLP